jgi:cyanate permease
VYWGITTPLYGISYFLPSIIKDLGYKSSTAQLLTVPIYIAAAIVAVVAAWLSDRRKQRSPFILFFMSLIAIGFIIVIASTGRGVPGVVYFGVFVAVIGMFFLPRQNSNQSDKARYLSCFPRKRHLAQRQPGGRLQACGRNGHPYRAG